MLPYPHGGAWGWCKLETCIGPLFTHDSREINWGSSLDGAVGQVECHLLNVGVVVRLSELARQLPDGSVGR